MAVKENMIRLGLAGITLLLLAVISTASAASKKVYTNKDLERYEKQPATSDSEQKPSSSNLKASRISVDFLDAEVYQVLRIIAEEARKKDRIEIFISPEMSGRVTVKMINVPWTEVLKDIEQKHNLTEIFLGKRTLLIYQKHII